MRKICLALCITLFASMIHAASMPIAFSNAHSDHQTMSIDTASQHCDEVADNLRDANSKPSCHGDSYQCCLGVVLVPLLAAPVAQDFMETPLSEYPTLALQPIINFIYKPPKSQVNFI